MITSEQRKILKKYLKGEYIKDVLAKLNEQNTVGKGGKPYSDKMVSHVFNGRYSNAVIEEAIVNVYIERKESSEKRRKELNRLLGIENEDDIKDNV